MSTTDDDRLDEIFGPCFADDHFVRMADCLDKSYTLTQSQIVYFSLSLVRKIACYEFIERQIEEGSLPNIINRDGEIDSDPLGAYGLKLAVEAVYNLTHDNDGKKKSHKEKGLDAPNT